MRYLFKYQKFQPEAAGVIKSGKKVLCDTAIHLDTETSHNHDKEHPKGWITSWAFEYNETVVCGRTPESLIESLEKVRAVNDCCQDGKHVVCFIHNLSYDIAYLFKYLVRQYGDVFDCLCIAPHKFITFTIGGIEFRCTWKLSNKSLAKWGRDLDIKHKKREGSYDYDLIRYQDDKLSFGDWKYQIWDILALKECVIKQNKLYVYNLATMPLTSTGYIRKDIRAESKKDDKNFRNFQRTALNPETLDACKREFSGGMTHGNRYYKAKTIINVAHYKSKKRLHFKSFKIDHLTEYVFVRHSMRHRDFVSHYPSQQRAKRCFPVGRFVLTYTEADNVTIKDILDNIDNKCSLIEISIRDLRVKQGVTIPFAQYSKFFQGKNGRCKFICDNGRVLSMEGMSTVVLTEYDLIILKEQYTFDYFINRVWQSRKDALPKFMLNSVDKYFYGKSQFKDVVEDLKKQGLDEKNERFFNASTDLMKSKNGLNGIYGCTATFPVRPEIKPDKYGNWSVAEDKDIAEELAKYYKNRNNFNRYQFGCYTTSLARYELYQFILAIGYDNVMYCDTDSIFYIDSPKVKERIDALNDKMREEAEKIGAYIVKDNGDKVYYDHFSDEDEDIYMFRFLHSKCYAYKEGHQTHVTIAGVAARSRDFYNDNITRPDELGCINNLKKGKVFDKCGGLTCKYTNAEISIEEINGHNISYADAAIIEATSKTLNNIEEDIDIDYIERWEAYDIPY